MLEHALKYASIGWRVFPLAPGQKTPLTAHGVKDATTDEYEIRRYWKRWVNANIGLACGAKSGVYVVDIDYDEEKGINGYESLKQLGEMPATVCQRTPSGGAHYLFALSDGAETPPANKNGLRPGIDIRGDGYYVVLAPSVHPNGGTYTWVDGHSPWEIQPAEYPDFMRVERERQEAPNQQRQFTNPMPVNGVDKLLRARAYFERVEPAIQGFRGHDCLMWAAQCCVHGLRMTDEGAYSFLATEYNPRCVPPWDLSDPKDEKDFRRKITEARRSPVSKPNGWILDDPGYAMPAGPPVEIDRESLIASAKVADAPAIQTTKKSSSASLGRLPDNLRHPTGWLGEYVGYYQTYSPTPNWPLAFCGGLALASAVTGRTIVGPSGIATNLYVLGLALPGTGKDFARKLNTRLLAEAGGLELLADKLASAEGIEDRLAESHIILYQPDEADALISAFESGRDTRSIAVGAALNQYFSSATSVVPRRVRAAAAEASVEPICRPHLTMFASATPELFYSALSSRSMSGGFLARTLPFVADPRVHRRHVAQPDLPSSMVEWVKDRLEFLPQNAGDVESVVTGNLKEASVVPATECGDRAMQAAIDAFSVCYTEAEPAGNHVAAALWSRAYELTEKLATIDAISDSPDNPAITGKMVDTARGVVAHCIEHSLKLVRDHSADTEFGRACNRMTAAIKRRGGEADRRSLQQSIRLRPRDFNDILASLVEQGVIDERCIPNARGTPTRVYRIINE